MVICTHSEVSKKYAHVHPVSFHFLRKPGTRTPPQVHTHTDGHFVGQPEDQFDKFNKLYWSLECSFVLWHIDMDCAGNWLSEKSTRQRVVAVMLSRHKSLPPYMLTRLVGLGMLLHDFYSCS